jgi:hypothetical protein
MKRQRGRQPARILHRTKSAEFSAAAPTTGDIKYLCRVLYGRGKSMIVFVAALLYDMRKSPHRDGVVARTLVSGLIEFFLL